MKRLRLERIDVFQLHTPDLAVSFDASMQALAELQKEGKIRHVALSNVTLEHIKRAQAIVPIVSVQNRYSFADREWNYVLDYCTEQGIAFLPWAPLAGGRQAHAVVESVARKLQATPQQVALAWLLKRSPIVLPIPGTSSAKHLEENIAAASLVLPDDQFEEMAKVRPEPVSFR